MDVMGSSSSPAKKKKAKSSRKFDLIQLRIATAKPGSEKYTHVDWNELLRENGKQRDEDELKRFYDEDTLFMAKKLAETRNKRGKRIRVNLDEIQHMNRNCGYDMEDSFIDDTEAVDNVVFTSKKGGFYAGKGDLKDMNDDEEDDSDDVDDDEEEEEQEMSLEAPPKLKKQKKKETKKTSDSSSSDSEGQRRLTGRPPTIRMSGCPPSAKRPRQSDGGGFRAPEVVNLTSTSSETSSGDVICIDDEPPTKKKDMGLLKVSEVATSSGANGDVICIDDEPKKELETTTSGDDAKILESTGSSSKPLNSSTKGSTVTILAKKICKQSLLETNGNKPNKPSTSSSTPATTATTTSSKPSSSSTSGAVTSSVTSSKPSNQNQMDKNREVITAKVSKWFEKIKVLGKAYKEKNEKTFDDETVKIIRNFILLLNQNQTEKTINIDALILHLSTNFGMKREEVMKMIVDKIQNKVVPKPDALVKDTPSAAAPPVIIATPAAHEKIDWKLTEQELPGMNGCELQMLTTIIKSWTPTKKMSNQVLNSWIKTVNLNKMTADEARLKFYDLVRNLPEVSQTEQQNGVEMPKHDRARKARMFLHQWVYLSRKNVEMILPGLRKNKVTADGLALKQVNAMNALKEALKKQIQLFENKKVKDKKEGKPADDAVYAFTFSEPIHAAIHTYLEDLTDYALSIGKLDVVATGIDALHPALDNQISLTQFHIEIYRRFQKLTFLIVEEPLKTRMKQANEHISKHQVVQNQKYQIKWPEGKEPSLRGLNTELHDFTRSVLVKAASTPTSKSTTPSRLAYLPSAPSTTMTSSNSTTVPRLSLPTAGQKVKTETKPTTISSTSSSSSVKTSSSGSGVVVVRRLGSSSSGACSSGATGAPSTSSAPSEDVAKQQQRIQAMNQLVQVKNTANASPLREQPMQRMTGRPPF